MKRIPLIIYGLFTAVLLLSGTASCSRDGENELTPEPQSTTVLLNLVPEMTADMEAPETRSATPLLPDAENLIRDIWVIQYDVQGVIRVLYTKHYRGTAIPVCELQSFPIDLAVLPDCTICFVANLNSGETEPASPWANTLIGFKEQYKEIAYRSGTGVEGLPDAPGLYMFGYYEGDISSSTPSLNVTLGRMLSCISLVVENATGESLTDVEVTVNNVVRRAYYYARTENPTLADTDYTSFTDAPGTLDIGQTTYLFYYVAPNLSPAQGKETTVTVQAKKNGSPVSTTPVALGGTADDHTIDRNGNYTITLSLR